MSLRPNSRATAPRAARPTLLGLVVLAGVAPAAPAVPITSFEGLPTGQNGAALFRQPSFSGSTAGFLAAAPNLAVVTAERASDGAQSLQVAWQFLPGPANPWLRLTTFNTTNVPNPTLDLSLPLRFDIFVPGTTPDFFLTLGVRETGGSAAVGADGGAVGPIEFVGATAVQGTAPVGRLITQKDAWVTVTFDFPSESVRAFTGNGQLDTGRGVLEHLAFTPVGPAAGPFVVFLDNFRQVAAVPAPGSAALVVSGLLPLAAAALRRRGGGRNRGAG
ncbi:MAG: hypothetical protein C0501_11695 [Isosphaera sp.]|nr:hypothetical protein [Isosphaera sp.]